MAVATLHWLGVWSEFIGFTEFARRLQISFHCSRDSVSETKPLKCSWRTSWVEYGNKVTINNLNQNSLPKNTFKRYNITNLLLQKSLPAEFLLYCSQNCPNSGWPPKLLIKRVFDHNFQTTLRVRGNGNFIKVIYLRVWKVIAGLPVVVGEVTRGHLKSLCKVLSREIKVI